MITATGRRVGRPTKEEEAAARAAEPQIRRWAPDDFDDWLLERLIFQWEGNERYWRAKLNNFVGSNSHLFVTNGEVTLLAVVIQHQMTAKPIIMEVFAWSRAADKKDDVYEVKEVGESGARMRAAYRHMREWGRALGATRVYVGVCSDMLPSRLRDMLGMDGYYLAAGPC